MYTWHPGKNLDTQTIGEILATMAHEQEPDTGESIPDEVRMVENPEHPFYQMMELPGGSTLDRHDPLHILLEIGTKITGEAFVLGLSMGADTSAKPWQLEFYIWWVTHKTPHPFVFSKEAIKAYWLGVTAAQDMKLKDIHLAPLETMHNVTINQARKQLGIDMTYLHKLYAEEKILQDT